MAITEESVAARAKILLTNRGEDASGVPLYRLITLIPNAKRKLANDKREAFRKDFTLTITAGVVSLAAHLAEAEPLILEAIRTSDIRSASSQYKWQWVGNRSVLSLQADPTDLFHYAQEGLNLYTDSTDAVASMRAQFDPTLLTVEQQGLDDELVEIVASMAAGGAVAAGG